MHKAIGGKILKITPERGIYLGPVRNKSGKIVDTLWREHYTVRKGNMIFDRITGPEGMDIHEYMKLFDYIDDLTGF